MAKLLKLRRGTTTQHASFTGAEGEVTIDVDKDVPVVHDGSTQGGHPAAAEDMANVSSANIAGRLANDSIAVSKIAAGTLPSDVKIADANVSGNLTIESADIVDGTIVNADVNASAAIAGTKVAPAFGSQNLSTSGTAATGALTVTGNIGVSGTVDGRDVAADGTKLDGIETAATADQTAAEIRTLVENASDSNVFTDADHTKLNGIATSATANPNALDNLVEDTSPQLGGDFDTNGYHIQLDDSKQVKFGDGNDMQIYHTGSHSYIENSTGHMYVKGNGGQILLIPTGSENAVKCIPDGAVELYFDGSKKAETVTGGFNVTGNMTATGNVTAYSDAKLKTDVSTINDSLGIVGKLRGVNYKWISDGQEDIGVIAQEVEKVVPEVVKETDDGTKTVDYGRLVCVLINAINELKAELDEHKKGGK